MGDIFASGCFSSRGFGERYSVEGLSTGDAVYVHKLILYIVRVEGVGSFCGWIKSKDLVCPAWVGL